MSSQLTVIIAGIVLVVAIVVALVIMRRGDSRFTYDTQHGTTPRATEGEGNTAVTAFKGRFSILTTGVGAMFAALAVKLWGMQMVSSDYYEKQANSNQTRTVTTPAVRGHLLSRNSRRDFRRLPRNSRSQPPAGHTAGQAPHPRAVFGRW